MKTTSMLQNDRQVMEVFARTFARTILGAEEFFRREFPSYPIHDRLRRAIRTNLPEHLSAALVEVLGTPVMQGTQNPSRMGGWAVAFLHPLDQALEKLDNKKADPE